MRDDVTSLISWAHTQNDPRYICIIILGHHWFRWRNLWLCAYPLPEQILTYCQLNPKKQTSVTFEVRYDTGIIIKVNAFENVVCQMVAILFRLICVSTLYGVTVSMETQSRLWSRQCVRLHHKLRYLSRSIPPGQQGPNKMAGLFADGIFKCIYTVIFYLWFEFHWSSYLWAAYVNLLVFCLLYWPYRDMFGGVIWFVCHSTGFPVVTLESVLSMAVADGLTPIWPMTSSAIMMRRQASVDWLFLVLHICVNELGQRLFG